MCVHQSKAKIVVFEEEMSKEDIHKRFPKLKELSANLCKLHLTWIGLCTSTRKHVAFE